MPAVADSNGAHRMRPGRVERKIRGELAHELTKAALSIDEKQAAALLRYHRVGVDEQLATRDQVEVVGS